MCNCNYIVSRLKLCLCKCVLHCEFHILLICFILQMTNRLSVSGCVKGMCLCVHSCLFVCVIRVHVTAVSHFI